MAEINSVYDLVKNELGITVGVSENPITPTIPANTVTRILPRNPRRVALTMINLGNSSVYIAPSEDVSTSKGILLTQVGGSISLTWKDDLTIVAEPWYAFSSGGSTIYVLEIWITGGKL